jgi:hypothetical protein
VVALIWGVGMKKLEVFIFALLLLLGSIGATTLVAFAGGANP